MTLLHPWSWVLIGINASQFYLLGKKQFFFAANLRMICSSVSAWLKEKISKIERIYRFISCNFKKMWKWTIKMRSFQRFLWGFLWGCSSLSFPSNIRVKQKAQPGDLPWLKVKNHRKKKHRLSSPSWIPCWSQGLNLYQVADMGSHLNFHDFLCNNSLDCWYSYPPC